MTQTVIVALSKFAVEFPQGLRGLALNDAHVVEIPKLIQDSWGSGAGSYSIAYGVPILDNTRGTAARSAVALVQLPMAVRISLLSDRVTRP